MDFLVQLEKTGAFLILRRVCLTQPALLGRWPFRPMTELKFKDLSVADTNVPSTGAVETSLNLIAQGKTGETRVGRNCTAVKLEVHGCAFLPAIDDVATPPEGELLRILLVLDTQPNGAVFTVTDVLDTADIFSPLSAFNEGRFAVLDDQSFGLNYSGSGTRISTDTADYAGMSLPYELDLQLDLLLEFSAAAAAIASVSTNNLAFLAITKNDLAGFEFTSRLWFSG